MTARACDKTPLARQAGGQMPARTGRPAPPQASARRSAHSRPVRRPALPDGRPGRGGDRGRSRSPAQANHAKRAWRLRIFFAPAAFPSGRRGAVRVGKMRRFFRFLPSASQGRPGKDDSLLIQRRCWANQETTFRHIVLHRAEPLQRIRFALMEREGSICVGVTVSEFRSAGHAGQVKE